MVATLLISEIYISREYELERHFYIAINLGVLLDTGS